MKANELRIGNRINSDRGIVEVAQLELYQNRIGVKSPDFTHFVCLIVIRYNQSP
jgi:hypothetical protein